MSKESGGVQQVKNTVALRPFFLKKVTMNVFWDWNGTLCDDLFTALQAVNAILAKRGRQPIDLNAYYSYMDTPIYKFYEHLFDLQKEPMSVLGAEFYAFYDKFLRKDCLMQGAYETLTKLKQAGVRQFILSSSHRDSILPHITRVSILPFFEEVLAADDWNVTSKSERARLFCEQNGLRGEETWFVGDLLHDLDTAKLCGAHCLLIPNGHQSAKDLQTAGECFCPSITEVPKRIGL